MKKNPYLSYLELSSVNLIHNIRQFRNLAGARTKLSVAIKGNAYGHGQNIIAKILEPYADYFQVNSIEELELLRRVSKKKTFLLGYVQKEDLLKAVKLGCILSIFSLSQLRELNKAAQRLKIKQRTHISLDAYLGREGFLLGEFPKLFETIKKCEYVKVSGIYAHFANIEDTRDFSHAQKQINEYEKALKIARESGLNNLETHISATSGLLVYDKGRGLNSFIRLGIGVFGMWPSARLASLYKKTSFKLKPVLSWKTKVAQVKTLPKGFSVGYGLTYVTKKETKIAVIPQGYADGFDRGLSNKGEVLIRGARCRVVGRVSMNMFVADVSRVAGVQAEDEVVIIGRQGGGEITAEAIAKKLDTINYEITTRISALLPRVITY